MKKSILPLIALIFLTTLSFGQKATVDSLTDQVKAIEYELFTLEDLSNSELTNEEIAAFETLVAYLKKIEDVTYIDEYENYVNPKVLTAINEKTKIKAIIPLLKKRRTALTTLDLAQQAIENDPKLKAYQLFLQNHPAIQIENLAEFMDLIPNTSVLEIGAEKGDFLQYLAINSQKVNFYVNEINADNINELILLTSNNDDFVAKDHSFEIIEGAEKSTQAEDKIVDVVVLNNALHHFKFKSEMLSSLKKSMTADTQLYIVESILEMDHLSSHCDSRLHYDDIKGRLTHAGFRLVREGIFEGKWVYQFELK